MTMLLPTIHVLLLYTPTVVLLLTVLPYDEPQLYWVSVWSASSTHIFGALRLHNSTCWNSAATNYSVATNNSIATNYSAATNNSIATNFSAATKRLQVATIGKLLLLIS